MAQPAAARRCPTGAGGVWGTSRQPQPLASSCNLAVNVWGCRHGHAALPGGPQPWTTL